MPQNIARSLSDAGPSCICNVLRHWLPLRIHVINGSSKTVTSLRNSAWKNSSDAWSTQRVQMFGMLRGVNTQ